MRKKRISSPRLRNGWPRALAALTKNAMESYYPRVKGGREIEPMSAQKRGPRQPRRERTIVITEKLLTELLARCDAESRKRYGAELTEQLELMRRHGSAGSRRSRTGFWNGFLDGFSALGGTEEAECYPNSGFLLDRIRLSEDCLRWSGYIKNALGRVADEEAARFKKPA